MDIAIIDVHRIIPIHAEVGFSIVMEDIVHLKELAYANKGMENSEMLSKSGKIQAVLSPMK